MNSIEAIYLQDSYTKESGATVLSIQDGKFIRLDNNIFYPSGGGQPSDTGILIRESDNKEFEVIYAKKFENNVSIQIQPEGNLARGDKVKCLLNWERRYNLMKSHTATHILATILHKEAGALITGNQINTDKTRIDFNLENLDRDQINNYIDSANNEINRNLEVKTYYLQKEEALKIPGIIKLANTLPPETDELRIVEIGDLDTQADGGTHVKNTSEIGKIELVKCENKGKNNRRVYFKLKA